MVYIDNPKCFKVKLVWNILVNFFRVSEYLSNGYVPVLGCRRRCTMALFPYKLLNSEQICLIFGGSIRVRICFTISFIFWKKLIRFLLNKWINFSLLSMAATKNFNYYPPCTLTYPMIFSLFSNFEILLKQYLNLVECFKSYTIKYNEIMS